MTPTLEHAAHVRVEGKGELRGEPVHELGDASPRQRLVADDVAVGRGARLGRRREAGDGERAARPRVAERPVLVRALSGLVGGKLGDAQVLLKLLPQIKQMWSALVTNP